MTPLLLLLVPAATITLWPQSPAAASCGFASAATVLSYLMQFMVHSIKLIDHPSGSVNLLACLLSFVLLLFTEYSSSPPPLHILLVYIIILIVHGCIVFTAECVANWQTGEGAASWAGEGYLQKHE